MSVRPGATGFPLKSRSSEIWAHGKDNHRTTLHGWVQRFDLKAKRFELLFSVLPTHGVKNFLEFIFLISFLC